MNKEDRKLWEEALAIIDDNLQIVEGDIIGNRFATASIIVEFAQAQVKKLTIPVVGVQSEQLVCECGEKPKDVPNDGYSYNCNKCRKPFAN